MLQSRIINNLGKLVILGKRKIGMNLRISSIVVLWVSSMNLSPPNPPLLKGEGGTMTESQSCSPLLVGEGLGERSI
jgi:hypothetical protein